MKVMQETNVGLIPIFTFKIKMQYICLIPK